VIAQRDLSHDVGSTVRGIVVYKDCFPVATVQAGFETTDQFFYIVPLIECGYNDGQFRAGLIALRSMRSVLAHEIGSVGEGIMSVRQQFRQTAGNVKNL
jgi:hypothetical protein